MNNEVITKHPSAKTCIKQVPAGFKIIDKYFGWYQGTKNFDIGGGKYELMTEELSKKGVTNLVFDPYNRSLQHNIEACQLALDGVRGVHSVTIFNVLNVIENLSDQLHILEMAKMFLLNGGVLYVRSTYKNPAKVSGYTKSGTFQHYKTQKEYLEIVQKVFPEAKLMYGIIIAHK
jgi:hypothetical protein